MSNIDVPNKADKIEFISHHLNELRRIAAAERLEMLSYLIEMAYVEACEQARTDYALSRIMMDRQEVADNVPVRRDLS